MKAGDLIEHLAGVEDFELAVATFNAARRHYYRRNCLRGEGQQARQKIS
jgi:hypothetical protein